MEKTIDIGQYAEFVINWLKEHLEVIFNFIKFTGEASIIGVENFLLATPFYLFIILIAIIGWFKVSKGFSLFSVFGLLIIYFMGFWSYTMETLALITVSTFIELLIAIPLGILIAKRKIAGKVIYPVLDLMQTMPAFVYLIPAVLFFSLGKVPGAFATIIFAMPPAVRLTALGLKQVPKELEEAARAFGCTPLQMLFKVELPTAKKTIFAGINQTIMMSLSMVVVAGMISAGGLGEKVLEGINTLDIGLGFESGLAVVIIAIILDRITQSLGKKSNNISFKKFSLYKVLLYLSVFSILLSVIWINSTKQDNTINNLKKVSLANVSGWTEGESMNNLVKYMLEEQGYEVTLHNAALDLIFTSLANGDTDFYLDVWLPHSQSKKLIVYKDKLIDLGVAYEGAKIGLVVPSYMTNINSIDDLRGNVELFNGTIYGIEKGAAISIATDKLIPEYSLSGYMQNNSSTAAMLAELKKSYDKEKPIVVGLWQPHWAFDRWDLKFLKDTKNFYGDDERIHKFSRLGINESDPKLTEFIRNISFSNKEMASLLSAFRESDEDSDKVSAAKKWISSHQELVDSWLKPFSENE